MAARKLRVQHDDMTRLKIKTSQLINRLSDHAFGKTDLSNSQVRAIEVLLRKTIPDLSQVDAAVTVARSPEQMSDAELADIAAGRGAHADQTEIGSDGPGSLH